MVTFIDCLLYKKVKLKREEKEKKERREEVEEVEFL